mmetsp:Transcript_34895/g.75622  ORF Transcript_34895/g.75622 Transcript_34895/m.75622 type:complete len:1183 (+) Transcript_34895:233-3781(+)
MGKSKTKKSGHMRLVDDYDDEASWNDISPPPTENDLEGQQQQPAQQPSTASWNRGHDDDDDESVYSTEEIEVEFGMPTLTSSGTLRPPQKKFIVHSNNNNGRKSTVASNDEQTKQATADGKRKLCAGRWWCRLGCCLVVMAVIAAAVVTPLLLMGGGGNSDGGAVTTSPANEQDIEGGASATDVVKVPPEASGDETNIAEKVGGDDTTISEKVGGDSPDSDVDTTKEEDHGAEASDAEIDANNADSSTITPADAEKTIETESGNDDEITPIKEEQDMVGKVEETDNVNSSSEGKVDSSSNKEGQDTSNIKESDKIDVSTTATEESNQDNLAGGGSTDGDGIEAEKESTVGEANSIGDTADDGEEGSTAETEDGDKIEDEDGKDPTFEVLSEVSGGAVYVAGSPQNKAAKFVAFDDPRGPRDVSDPLFLQRYALATLYYSTSGDEWEACGEDCELNGHPFLSDAHECLWMGIMCLGDGRIATIDFGRNGLGLSGEIPSEIGLLSSLMRLNVQGNKITSIPNTLAKTPIVELILSNNNIQSFPTALYGKRTLEKLHIDRNNFKEEPLPNFAAFPKLQHIQAHYNSFTGTIDPNIGNLSKLRNLDLSFNELTGIIPSELGKLERLVRLDVASNQLTGGLSPSVVSMPRLITLSASNNMLLGSIPPEIGRMGSYWDRNGLQRDKTIRLNGNFLEGEIPAALAYVQGLTEVALHGGNLFFGQIPQELCDLDSLSELSVNCATVDCQCTDACVCIGSDGQIVDAEPVDVALTQTEESSVEEANNASGTSDQGDKNGGDVEENAGTDASDEVFSALKAISGDDIHKYGTPAYNAARWTLLFDPAGTRAADDPRLIQRYALATFFYGTGIQRFISTNAADECEWLGITCDVSTRMVTEIKLHDHSLHGSIAKELGQLTYLTKLDLSNNELSGPIPDTLGETQLQDLLLSNNNLQSPFPPTLYNKESITRIFIDRNTFTGPLPEWSLMPNLTHISAFDNSFIGSLDPGLGSLANLRILLLNSNKLQGTIPPKLSNLEELEKFEAANNVLSGEIPAGIFSLPRLLSLSLSNNQLTGEISRSVKNMGSSWSNDGKPKRKYIKLENNSLTGTIPKSLAQIKNLYVLTLHGNAFKGDMPDAICELKVASSGFSYDLFRLTSDCTRIDCSCSAACKCIASTGSDEGASDWKKNRNG